jgi:acyl phosphate:glycerol-3-phosphate acyltransferase
MHPAELLTFALILLPAYLLGSVPFGLLIGRLGGIDVRKHGSGNIGATNVWRVLGPKWGGTTFLLDAGKGFAAVRLAENIAWARVPQPVPEDYLAYATVFAALACILGHTFPVWLLFKGGKGVATSLGVLLAVMPPVATGIVLGVWIVVFAASRYVSLASILAALSLPITVGALLFLDELQGRAYFAFACAAAFLVVRRHRENIKRLFAGTESRFKKSNA